MANIRASSHSYVCREDLSICVKLRLFQPPGPKNNTKIDFRVQEISGSSELIALESCDSKNCFISILPDGHLKTTNLKEKKVDAQFSVIAVVSIHRFFSFTFSHLSSIANLSTSSTSFSTSPYESIREFGNEWTQWICASTATCTTYASIGSTRSTL